jgi:hypothetical protein
VCRAGDLVGLTLPDDFEITATLAWRNQHGDALLREALDAAWRAAGLRCNYYPPDLRRLVPKTGWSSSYIAGERCHEWPHWGHLSTAM